MNGIHGPISPITQINQFPLEIRNSKLDEKIDGLATKCFESEQVQNSELGEAGKKLEGRESFEYPDENEINSSEATDEENEVFFEDDEEPYNDDTVKLASESFQKAIEKSEEKNLGVQDVSASVTEKIQNKENSLENFAKSIKENLNVLNITHLDESNFEENVQVLHGKISESAPEKREGLIQDFIQDEIENDRIGLKGINGEFIPLTRAQKEEVKEKLKNYICDYFNGIGIIVTRETSQKQNVDQPNKEAHKSEEKHQVALFKTDRPLYSKANKNIIEIEIIKKNILLGVVNEIVNKAAEKEKDEKRLQQIADKIMEFIIKAEILKYEINLLGLKVSLKKEFQINISEKSLVKILETVYSPISGTRSEAKTTFQQMPGIHQVKSLKSKAAA